MSSLRSFRSFPSSSGRGTICPTNSSTASAWLIPETCSRTLRCSVSHSPLSGSLRQTPSRCKALRILRRCHHTTLALATVSVVTGNLFQEPIPDKLMTKSSAKKTVRLRPRKRRHIPVDSPSAAILFYQAADFAAAADACVATYGPNAMAHVTMFLLARSFELAVKAGLRAKGLSRAELQHGFGHDLESLLRESDRLGLLMIDTWTPDVTCGIENLNEAYASKELEYVDTGAFSGPTPGFLRELLHHALFRAALFALRPDVRERLLNRDPPIPGFSLRMLDHYRTPPE